ncbi:DUF2849 domain-containing protein [Govanella unica]|uniref:DUF2849 domain-containing protein n=1 Tax=Govanella unica TaxID=2975056 RepID=A0A9X3U0V3_9PROT|nr:DUF2849 domain-containing protein [Govania unica]MDA5194962.1 DUF2849 domain-containing protein [Govania unica]
MEDGSEIFKVITANRLHDGVIVYARAQGTDLDWVTQIANATAFGEAEITDALERAERAAAANIVVSLYPVEVAGRNRPLSARETVRAKGPSVKYGHAAVDADYSI